MSEVSRRYSPYVYGNDNPMRFIDADGMIAGEAQKQEDYSRGDYQYSDGYSNSNASGITGAVSINGALTSSGGGDSGGSADSGPGDPPNKASLIINSSPGKPTEYNPHHNLHKSGFKKGSFWDFLFNKMLGGPVGAMIPSPMAIIESGAVSVTAIVGEEVAVASSNAAKGSTKLITQFSSSTIDDAVKIVANDANKLNHLFPAKHNLGSLVDKLGGQENTVRAVLNAANGKLPASGLFNNIPVNVGGSTVFIRGNVINGVPRLGTMFIP